MTPGFQNLPYEGATLDGKNWVHTKPLEYLSKSGKYYRAVKGGTTDGPSVPEWAAALEWGPVWVCGVLHDACYRDQLETSDDGQNWSKYTVLVHTEADNLFDEAMEIQGVNALERELFYRAVVTFGKKAFRDDRQHAVENNPT